MPHRPVGWPAAAAAAMSEGLLAAECSGIQFIKSAQRCGELRGSRGYA